MPESCPLRPDESWNRGLVCSSGGAVPPTEHLQIRRGLQPIVGELLTQLSDLDLLRHVDIISVVTLFTARPAEKSSTFPTKASENLALQQSRQPSMCTV